MKRENHQVASVFCWQALLVKLFQFTFSKQSQQLLRFLLFKTFMKMKRENHLGLLDLKKLHHCRIVVWPP